MEKKLNRMMAALGIFVFVLLIGVGVYVKGAEYIKTYAESRKLPIYCVDEEEKKIAISFDAAWGNENTQGILDILESYDIKTTFFLVGFWVDEYKEDVRNIYSKGHEIQSHSATHPDLTTISEEEIMKELDETSEKIESLIGVKPNLIRPPFGAYNNDVIEICEENGYKVIQWDVDSLDWKDLSTDQIVERVIRNVKNGSIVLFHNNAEEVLNYLPAIIETLKRDGYEIVPVSELIMWEGYEIDHSGKQIEKERVEGEDNE